MNKKKRNNNNGKESLDTERTHKIIEIVGKKHVFCSICCAAAGMDEEVQECSFMSLDSCNLNGRKSTPKNCDGMHSTTGHSEKSEKS